MKILLVPQKSGRSWTLFVGVLGVLGATACAGDATGGAGNADPTGVTGSSDEAFTNSGASLTWQGAAQNRVMESGFGITPGVYAADIGVSTVCDNGIIKKCVRVVQGLQVFSYNPATNTTSADVIGHPTAGAWTRVVCPNGGFVTGYNVGITKEVGPTLIGHFGFRCMTLAGVRSETAILGGGHELFTQFPDCTPSTSSPRRFVSNVLMNRDGNGVGGVCADP